MQRLAGLFGTVILVLGCVSESGCVRAKTVRMPLMAPPHRADAASGRPSLTTPSSDEALKRLDQQAQRLFEQLKQKTGASGRSESAARLSDPAGQMDTQTPTPGLSGGETATHNSDADSEIPSQGSGPSTGRSTLSGSSQYDVAPRAGILTACALIAMVGVILLLRRHARAT